MRLKLSPFESCTPDFFEAWEWTPTLPVLSMAVDSCLSDLDAGLRGMLQRVRHEPEVRPKK